MTNIQYICNRILYLYKYNIRCLYLYKKICYFWKDLFSAFNLIWMSEAAYSKRRMFLMLFFQFIKRENQLLCHLEGYSVTNSSLASPLRFGGNQSMNSFCSRVYTGPYTVSVTSGLYLGNKIYNLQISFYIKDLLFVTMKVNF